MFADGACGYNVPRVHLRGCFADSLTTSPVPAWFRGGPRTSSGSVLRAPCRGRDTRGKRMKILIVDDHPLFRAGFHAVLEQSALESDVVCVSSLPEALQSLETDGDIDLVLLDIHLRGEDGFDALKVIGERFPMVACIMISGDEQPDLARRAIESGASGFIPKSFTADEMTSAIQRVLAGGIFAPQMETVGPPAGVGLTLRQLEVISMLGRGFSNKEIARALNVAERTVKAHVSAIFEFLNVKNRTQAVLRAQQLGFLSALPSYATAR